MNEGMARTIEDSGRRALERLRSSNEDPGNRVPEDGEDKAPVESPVEEMDAPPDEERLDLAEPEPAKKEPESEESEESDLDSKIIVLQRRQEEARQPAPAPAQQQQQYQEPHTLPAAPVQQVEQEPVKQAWKPSDDDFYSDTERNLYKQNLDLQRRLDEQEAWRRQEEETRRQARVKDAFEGFNRTVSSFQDEYPDVYGKDAPLAKVAAQHVQHQMLIERPHDDPELIVAEVAKVFREDRTQQRRDYVKSKLKQSRGRTLSGGAASRTNIQGKPKRTTARDLETGVVAKKALARLRADR